MCAMAQVWGCRKTEGLTAESRGIADCGWQLALPWAVIDTGITKSSFGAFSVAGRCVTAGQLLIHVNNGY